MERRYDCEHHTHNPSATRAPTAHDYRGAEATMTLRSHWGGVFDRCQACFDAGHMQGTEFR